jgi:hypothetical protein
MNWREEIKYPLTQRGDLVLRNLYSLGYRELFPPRIILSTYYDTPDYVLLSLGRRDVFPRYYVRTRSYDFNPPVLELKIREGNRSVKCRSSDPKNSIDGFSDEILWQLQTLGMPAILPLEPKITVSYRRFYLEHPRFLDVVLTLDEDLYCAPYPYTPDTLFSPGVVELKINGINCNLPPLPSGVCSAQGHSKIQLAFNSVYRGLPD